MTLEQQLRSLAGNRAAVVGSAAGVALVYLAWRQLRAQQAPTVFAVPAPAGSVDTGATALSAFQAGASAASSGFDTGASLGSSGIGLAGSVVTDLGSVAGALAQSQADMGATVSGSLSQAIGALTTPTQSPAPAPSPTPLPGTTPTPPPSPTPTPTPWPSSIGPRPAGATGYISVSGDTFYRWGSGGTRTAVRGRVFSAWVAAMRLSVAGGSPAPGYEVLTGAYAGWHVYAGAAVRYRGV